MLLMPLSVTLGAIALTALILMRWVFGGLRHPIDVGVVSEGWLAEQKLGKRDAGVQ